MKTFCRWLERRGGVIAWAGLVAFPLAAQGPVRSRPAPTPSVTLLVDGRSVGTFREVSGLASAEDVATLGLEGGRVPPAARAPNRSVTLRGCNAQCAQYLQTWRRDVEEGRLAAARRTVTIVAADAARRETLRYTLTGAWPEQLSLRRSTGNSPVLDVTVVLAYAALRIVPGP